MAAFEVTTEEKNWYGELALAWESLGNSCSNPNDCYAKLRERTRAVIQTRALTKQEQLRANKTFADIPAAIAGEVNGGFAAWTYEAPVVALVSLQRQLCLLSSHREVVAYLEKTINEHKAKADDYIARGNQLTSWASPPRHALPGYPNKTYFDEAIIRDAHHQADNAKAEYEYMVKARDELLKIETTSDAYEFIYSIKFENYPIAISTINSWQANVEYDR